MNDELQKIDAAGDLLRAAGCADVRIGLVLGSGLRAFADTLTERTELPFAEVPHWPVPKVEGHGGSLVVGKVDGVRVACLTGRVHLYEGFRPAEVVRAVRTLRRVGVATFLLTNAAGGIGAELNAGSLMRITDHLNLSGSSPLCGAHVPEFGPRFPDQSRVWDAEAGAVLDAVDPDLGRGVYAGLLGPSYETPAEVQMLRTLGAGAVGMSTVHEAIALNAMGARLAGVSLISNLAAGISPVPLSHQEVVEAGRKAEPRMVRLVAGFCRRMHR